TSNQGLTFHEDVIGIDFCGLYTESHGAGIRNIQDSRALLIGTTIRNDRGDKLWGGPVHPTGVRADDNAVIWADRVRIDMPAGSIGYHASAVTSAIHVRERYANGLRDVAVGTIANY